MQEANLDFNTTALQIVDGNNYLIRRFRDDTEGLIIRNIYRDISACARPPLFVFDGLGGNARRRKLFPGYKSRRAKQTPRDDVRATKDLFVSMMPFMPCSYITLMDWEADDVMASLARLSQEPVRVITNDKDICQLAADPRITVTSSFEDVKPHDVRLYKTFIGDPSDSIPGVAKYGPMSWGKLNKVLIKTLLDNNGDFTHYQSDHLGLSERHHSWICGNQALIKTFWEITQLYDVPLCDIVNNIKVGMDNFSKINDILMEFML